MYVWFLFFFLTSDVSTFQENDYCKDHLMSELIDLRKQKNRLLTEYRLISTNKKIDYWLNVENSKKKIDNWLSFSQIHDHFRWFTMRQMKIKCNHRFQKKNFRFVDLKMLYVNFIQFTKIRSVDSWLFARKFSFHWLENVLCKFHSIHEDSFCSFVTFF